MAEVNFDELKEWYETEFRHRWPEENWPDFEHLTAAERKPLINSLSYQSFALAKRFTALRLSFVQDLKRAFR